MADERGGGGPGPPGASPPPGPGPGPGSPVAAAELQLLVVVGALRSAELLQLVLRDIEEGVRSWTVGLDVCVLDQQLKLFVSRHSAFLSEEVRGQRTLRYHGDVLDTQVLVNPAHECVCSEVRRLVLGPGKQKLLVVSGRRLDPEGDVELQDGFLSAWDLIQILSHPDPDRDAGLAPPPPGCLTVAVPPVGSWLDSALSGLRTEAPPPLGPLEGLQEFCEYLWESLEPESPLGALEAPGFPGFLKLPRPCCYVFPAGRGDSAFFSVGGFNVLADGGSASRSCFWKLVRHLDRVDAVLVTNLGTGTLPGVNGLLLRKVAELELLDQENQDEDQTRNRISPDIGVVFINAPDVLRSIPEDPGQIRVRDQAGLTLRLLERLSIRPLTLIRTPEPLVLFQKMGVGRLEMFVLNPARKDPDGTQSICILLVWLPSGPDQKIVRVLFPGRTPQSQILDGLETLGHLDFLKRPSLCTKDLEGSETAETRSQSRESLKSKMDKTRGKEMDRTGTQNLGSRLKKPERRKDLKPEPRKDLKPEPRKDLKPEPRKDLKPEPRKDLKPEPKKDLKPEPRKDLKPEPRKDLKPEPRKDLKPEPRKDLKPEPKEVKRTSTTPTKLKTRTKPPPKDQDRRKQVTQSDPPHDVDLCLVTPCEFQHPQSAEIQQDPSDQNGNKSREPEPNGNGPPDPGPDSTGPQDLEPNGTSSPDSRPSFTGALDPGPEGTGPSEEDCTRPELEPNGTRLDPEPVLVKDKPPPPPQSKVCMVDPEAHRKGSRTRKTGPGTAGSLKTAPGSRTGTKTPSGPAAPPVYLDLAYLPSGPASSTVDSTLFRRLRSAHYVVSGDGPEKEAGLVSLLDSLLDGKESWPHLPATLIPTFDSAAMHQWFQRTAERQALLALTVLGSSSTVALQDDSFPACKVEF